MPSGQFAGAFALAGLVHTQVTRRLALARIPAEILEGLSYARTKPVILLVFGITVVTNAFAFAYQGLVAPLGRGVFHVSPGFVGVLAEMFVTASQPGQRAFFPAASSLTESFRPHDEHRNSIMGISLR